jgi:hypothetical protein
VYAVGDVQGVYAAPSRLHWKRADSLAEKLKLAEVLVTEPVGPALISVSGLIRSGVVPGSRGAKPMPAWSSPPNRAPSLPTQSPRGVAIRTIVPWLRDFSGFQDSALPVVGWMAAMPGRHRAPGPSVLQP